MPFKSKAQRRLFYAKMNRGEMSPGMVKKWESHTPKDKTLPEKVEKKAMDKKFFEGFEKKALQTMKMLSPIRKGMGPGMKAGQQVKGVANKTLKQIKV